MISKIRILVLALVVLLATATSGTAASTALRLRMGSQIHLLSPYAGEISISYYCVGQTATIFVGANQIGSAYLYTGSTPLELPCTGRWVTYDEYLSAPPNPPVREFVPGTASARAYLNQGTQSVSIEGKEVRVIG